MAMPSRGPLRRVVERRSELDVPVDVLECGHTKPEVWEYGGWQRPAMRSCPACAVGEPPTAWPFLRVRRVGAHDEVLYEPETAFEMAEEIRAVVLTGYDVLAAVTDRPPFTHRILVDFGDDGEPWTYLVQRQEGDDAND